MRRALRALSLLAALSAAAACATRNDPAAAVRRYAEVVSAAYREDDPSRLPDVATAREARRIAAVLERKRGDGLVFDARLLELEVLGTEAVGDDRATVRTTERWRCWDRPLRPGVAGGREYLAQLGTRYSLVRDGARWKVADTSAPAVQYYDPVSERPIDPPERHGPPAAEGVQAGDGGRRSLPDEPGHVGGPRVDAW